MIFSHEISQFFFTDTFKNKCTYRNYITIHPNLAIHCLSPRGYFFPGTVCIYTSVLIEYSASARVSAAFLTNNP